MKPADIAQSIRDQFPRWEQVLNQHRCHVERMAGGGCTNTGDWNANIIGSLDFKQEFFKALRVGWDILRRARDECVAAGWLDGMPPWPANRNANPADMRDEASEAVWTLLRHRDELLVWLESREPPRPDSLTGEEKALALLVKHPEWSDVRIANEVGCSRTSLYRWERYTKAREALEQGRRDRPRGEKDSDGNLDAW